MALDESYAVDEAYDYQYEEAYEDGLGTNSTAVNEGNAGTDLVEGYNYV